MKKLIISALVAVLAVSSLACCSGKDAEKAKQDAAMRQFLGTDSVKGK
jgi:hypothetical protein